MGATHRKLDLTGERTDLGEGANRFVGIAGTLGVLGLLASGVLGFTGGADPARFYQSYLVAFVYFLSLTLGALFFVLIQHLTRAGWSVVIRRIAEGFAANALLLAVLAAPVVLGMGHLYEWTSAEAMAHSPLLAGKAPYLNRTFFVIRLAIYFLVWIGLSQYFFSRSVRQDATGDATITSAMQKVSAPAMFLFAITLTFASFDLVMSLEPEWFSTIYGVYFFSGSMLGFMSLLPIVSFLLQRSGRLSNVISIDHYHDIGKLMFAFLVFWGYIAFSQYMLYWYANIPEETVWFLRRQTGEWRAFSWFMLLGHFLVPFLALISRIPKRQKGALALGAVWMLFIHYADIYYLAMPHASEGKLPLHLLDLTCFVGIGGLWFAAFANRMRGHALVPTKDPRLSESLAFENF